MERFVGSEPEHVVRGRPNQGPRARQVERAHDVREAPHDGERGCGCLAFDEIGRGRDLVSNRGGGDLQRFAGSIRRPAEVVEHTDAGRADRGVGLPFAPWPPERIADDHPDVETEAIPPRRAECQRSGVGVLGQQQHDAVRRITRVDAGRGHHQPERVLYDAGDAPGILAARDEAHRLTGDRVFAVCRGHLTPLGFAHDLARHRDDVARLDHALERVTEQLNEVVTGDELGEAGDAERAEVDGHQRRNFGSTSAPKTSRNSS